MPNVPHYMCCKIIWNLNQRGNQIQVTGQCWGPEVGPFVAFVIFHLSLSIYSTPLFCFFQVVITWSPRKWHVAFYGIHTMPMTIAILTPNLDPWKPINLTKHSPSLVKWLIKLLVGERSIELEFVLLNFVTCKFLFLGLF